MNIIYMVATSNARMIQGVISKGRLTHFLSLRVILHTSVAQCTILYYYYGNIKYKAWSITSQYLPPISSKNCVLYIPSMCQSKFKPSTCPIPQYFPLSFLRHNVSKYFPLSFLKRDVSCKCFPLSFFKHNVSKYFPLSFLKQSVSREILTHYNFHFAQVKTLKLIPCSATNHFS